MILSRFFLNKQKTINRLQSTALVSATLILKKKKSPIPCIGSLMMGHPVYDGKPRINHGNSSHPYHQFSSSTIDYSIVPSLALRPRQFIRKFHRGPLWLYCFGKTHLKAKLAYLAGKSYLNVQPDRYLMLVGTWAKFHVRVFININFTTFVLYASKITWWSFDVITSCIHEWNVHSSYANDKSSSNRAMFIYRLHANNKFSNYTHGATRMKTAKISTQRYELDRKCR